MRRRTPRWWARRWKVAEPNCGTGAVSGAGKRGSPAAWADATVALGAGPSVIVPAHEPAGHDTGTLRLPEGLTVIVGSWAIASGSTTASRVKRSCSLSVVLPDT